MWQKKKQNQKENTEMSTREEVVLKSERDSLLRQASLITGNPNSTARELKHADTLLAQAASLRSREAMQIKAAAVLEDCTGVHVEIEGYNEDARNLHGKLVEYRNYAREGRVPTYRTYSPLVSSGNGFVPSHFHQDVFSAMAQYDDIWLPEVSTFIETEQGGAMTLPTFTDLSQSSSQIGEAVQDSSATIGTVAKVTLNSYTQRSGMVFLTAEALQNFGVDTMKLLNNSFSLRFARGCGQLSVTGTGSGQPQGIATAAPVGATAGSSTQIGHLDLQALYFSVNPYFRKVGRWLMNDTTVQQISQLVDSNGRPLINLQADVLTLMGRPVNICPSFASPSSGAVVACFGDTKQFVIRTVTSDTHLQRFTELPNVAENALVGFQSYLRFDSRLVISDSSFPPVTSLKMAS
jgi:HK97 family phage major capsid protein